MENEVIYIATDETDLSMFDPFKDRARVRFLSDYYERAGVSELDPNLLGMMEQVRLEGGREGSCVVFCKRCGSCES